MRSPRIAMLELTALLAFSTTGCVFAPVVPPRGILYTNQRSPLMPMGRPGQVEGRASSYSLMFLVAWGDSGLKRAMANGEILDLRHVDYQIENYALVFQKYTTIAVGEKTAPPPMPIPPWVRP